MMPAIQYYTLFTIYHHTREGGEALATQVKACLEHSSHGVDLDPISGERILRETGDWNRGNRHQCIPSLFNRAIELVCGGSVECKS